VSKKNSHFPFMVREYLYTRLPEVYIAVMLEEKPTVELIKDRYRARIEAHGESELALGWRENTSQHRYQAVSRVVSNLSPNSILDIGTGYGFLLNELRKDGWSGIFTGLDVLPEFISAARIKYQVDDRADFQVSEDFFSFERYTADFSVGLGLLNHVSTADLSFRLDFLDRIANVSQIGFVVDFLCNSSNRKSKELVYQEVTTLVNWATQNNFAWFIDHSYLRFEFMFVVLTTKSNLEDFLY